MHILSGFPNQWNHLHIPNAAHLHDEGMVDRLALAVLQRDHVPYNVEALKILLGSSGADPLVAPLHEHADHQRAFQLLGELEEVFALLLPPALPLEQVAEQGHVQRQGLRPAGRQSAGSGRGVEGSVGGGKEEEGRKI